MHAHVQSSNRAMIDDDNFNSFWGIASEGHTHRQTEVHKQTQGRLWLYVNFALQTKSNIKKKETK